MKRKSIKVVYEKLGKEKVWGYTTEDNTIHVDERCKGKKHCEIIIHETLHCLFPNLEENEIENKAIILTNLLWKEQYRRIDNSNNEPLQDGKK